MAMLKDINSENEMKDFGRLIGSLLHGGEIIELLGDVGVGKTTLVKGIAIGLAVDEYVQSPSFTINRVYEGRDNLTLSHYDFYRLSNAGIMTNELRETISDPKTITIIEWGEIVSGVLPTDRLSIRIVSPAETSRRLTITSGGDNSRKLESGIGL